MPLHTEPVAEVEVVEVVDENPPRFANVTDYLALKTDTNWSWKSLADTPDIEEWYSKIPAKNEHAPEDPSYSIRGGLDGYGGMAVYGTKEKPEIITIGSGQAVMDDETGAAVYKLEDLFRASLLELSQIVIKARTSCSHSSFINGKIQDISHYISIPS